MSDSGQSNRVDKHVWYMYLPILFCFGWWVADLQYHWSVIPEYQFGWFVIMLAAYVFYEKYPTRPKNDQPSSLALCWGLAIIGSPFVLAAEVFKACLSYSPASSFMLSIGCSLFITSMILFLHGPATFKYFSFPLFFLFVAVPLPSMFWEPIVLGLRQMITWFDVQTLNLIGIPAVQHVNVIQLPRCSVGVDDACSGIRSLQSSIMASLFIGYLSLKLFSSRMILFIGGIIFAVVGNFFRSLYLALTAHYHGSEAIAKVHDTAGWSILAFTAVGLILLAWILVKIEKIAFAEQKQILSKSEDNLQKTANQENL